MWRLTLLLFLPHMIYTETFYDQNACAIDHRSLENIQEYKLVKTIKSCGYSLFTPPPTNSSVPLKIKVKFVMKSFKFDSKQQQFSALMWTYLSWKDYRLHWDPSKHAGINNLVVSTITIWAPMIQLLNEVHKEWDSRYWYIPCKVNSTGSVWCISQVNYKAKCSTDLKDWPYDAQICQFEFGPIPETETKIQLDAGAKAVSMFLTGYGAEWDITDYQQESNMTSDKQLITKFRLERHGDVLAAIVIFPSIILTALTFLSLFLDARLNLRLLILCFSLMNHFDFLSNLAQDIPDNTKDPPRLLMYYRGSFILTSVLIVQSIVFKLVCKRNVVCFDWIKTINDFVYMKLPEFIIWPRWDTKVDVDISASNFDKDWTDFANIVNSVWIVVTVIVYVCLYCVFMPHPIPYDIHIKEIIFKN